MGQEALCTVQVGSKVSRGKALLESEALIFRGEFRLKIPFRAMQSVKAARGELHVQFAEGTASFSLGDRAEVRAEKILHPKSLLDKLGIKPGSVVSVLGVGDASFLRRLGERTQDITPGRPRKDSDFIFFGAEARADLQRLRDLVSSLKKTGAIWVVYPKGQPKTTQADVMPASKKAGLVDVKVASFSPTHTTLKLVIPISRR